MAITNWPTNKRMIGTFYYDYMQKPKQPYHRVPKTGSVDIASQEKSVSEQEYVGLGRENKPFSPSTTEKEPSAASKRKTITLNERAKSSISTMERSPNSIPSLDDQAEFRRQRREAMEWLRMLDKKYKEEKKREFLG